MIISLIAAMSTNRVIGISNRLPWNMPADVAYFKRTTAGKKFIMGRKTYEAADAFYSDVENIVVTRNKEYQVDDNSRIADSFETALQLAAEGDEEVFVIGGAEIFKKAMPYANQIYVTVIHSEFTGDAYFPIISPSKWKLAEQTDFKADEQNPYNYSFLRYTRRGRKQ